MLSSLRLHVVIAPNKLLYMKRERQNLVFTVNVINYQFLSSNEIKLFLSSVVGYKSQRQRERERDHPSQIHRFFNPIGKEITSFAILTVL